MTGCNECMAAVYKVVQLAAWKITVWSKICSFWVLADFGYNWRRLAVEGSGWLSCQWCFPGLTCVSVSGGCHGLYPALGGCCGTPGLLAPLLLPAHWSRDKGIYTSLSLEGLQSLGSSLAMERKHFMWYLKCWTGIHSRHFLSSEVWAEGRKKKEKT